MQLLHELASVAVEVALKPQDKAASDRLTLLLQDVPPELKEPGGAFVTLFNDGHVRGCMGTADTVNPLYKMVVFSGFKAALDPRFPPELSASELEQLDVKVSVLSKPQSVVSYRDFVLGKEGVLLEKDGHDAVFLPEVPLVYHWGREYMLTRLALKAGLPANAWKDGASIKTFRTRSLSAPYMVMAQ
jgi:AmmeMemoRadiSam system protein A